MTPETRQEVAFITVHGWLVDALGKEAANLWCWSCTPYPFGLPTEESLQEGLAVATGELSLDALRKRIHDEMYRDFCDYQDAEKTRIQEEASSMTTHVSLRDELLLSLWAYTFEWAPVLPTEIEVALELVKVGYVERSDDARSMFRLTSDGLAEANRLREKIVK